MKKVILIVLVLLIICLGFYYGYKVSIRTKGIPVPGEVKFGEKVANPQEEWNKVLEVNKIWLDPHPRNLQYALYKDPMDSTMSMETEKVDIQDDRNWSWEMKGETFNGFKNQKELFGFSVQCRDGMETYLVPEEMKSRGAQPMGSTLSFREGIQWQCGIHYLATNGLPLDNLQMSEKKGTEDILLMYAYPTNSRANMGLGLRKSFFGRAQYGIKMIRLYIRKPDYVPILEEDFEDVNGDIKLGEIEFGPDYFQLGNQKAPVMQRMRSMKSGFSNFTSWVLEAHFQVSNNTWLLKEGLNIQNENTVKRIYTQVPTTPGDTIANSQQSQPTIMHSPRIAIQSLRKSPSPIEIANQCKENLRNLDIAKSQWALEQKYGATDKVTLSDVTAYLRNPSAIVCPLNGKPYDIGKDMSISPSCPNYNAKDPVLALHKI